MEEKKAKHMLLLSLWYYLCAKRPMVQGQMRSDKSCKEVIRLVNMATGVLHLAYVCVHSK